MGSRIAGGSKRAGSRFWLASALVLAGLSACSSGKSSSGKSTEGGIFSTAPEAGGGPGGSVVAELELIAPKTTPFVLRGTFPVPKGTYPRADKKEPFSIRNYDGLVVPTQVEIVSRYPLDKDGADVVEVVARVDVPPGTPPDARVRYEVVNDPHKDGKLPVKSAVLQLASKPGQVLLVANDVFGHRYGLDLLEDVRTSASGQGPGKVMRQGSGAVTIRTYGVMEPDPAAPKGAPSGTLPHLFGAHTYFTAWAWSDLVSLELRINNAASGLDKQSSEDDPLGKAYFKSLEVWVPKGWTLMPDVVDPYWGTTRDEGSWTAYELVRPMSNGSMHVMPAQSNFVRRLALVQAGKEPVAHSLLSGQWVGFNRRGYVGGVELYSWWNRSAPGYFPQKHRLPELDFIGYQALASDVNGEHNSILNKLTSGQGTGNYPFQADVLGWAQPYGTEYGGMTGGSEIFLYDGFKTAEVALSAGYRTYELLNRMYASRMPDKLFDKNGEPTNVESWVVNGSQYKYVNMNFFQKLLSGSNDPFGMSSSPGFQRTYVNNMGLAPPYESELESYFPIDFQHYIRYTRAPKVLAWLGNDPLAKDELRAAAEIFRMSYHQHYTTPAGGTTVSQYLPDKQFVNNSPAEGFTFGRGEAWGLDVAIAAYATGDPAWRALTKPWIDLIADTLTNGQSSCNKMIQANVQSKALNGAFQVRQSIEQAITENMLYGMIASVHRDADPGRAAALTYTLETSTEGMIGPMCWSDGSQTGGKVGPHGYMAVAPLNGSLPPYCGSLPPGGFGNGVDQFQVWSSFAYGFELTGNASFHSKAAAMAGGGGSLWNQMVGMGMENLENRLALLADLQ
jgi:hypothetical protein